MIYSNFHGFNGIFPVKRLLRYSVSFCLILINFSALGAMQLANYIGTGTTPRSQIHLSQNGANWAPFVIDYQQMGEIPFSTKITEQWST